MWKELVNLFRSDDLLDQAWAESRTMLDAGQEMLLEAMRVLREEEGGQVAPEIRAKDKLVNQFERDVRRKVMTHCSVSDTTNLSSAMVLASIVIDIERIGDYCKNIMDLAVMHPHRLTIPEFDEELRGIEDAVRTRYIDTISVFVSQDAEEARKLLESYKEEITRTCDGMVERVIAGEIASLSPRDAATTVLYVRYLKRIGAHLKNVTTCVVHPFEWIGFRKVKQDTDNK